MQIYIYERHAEGAGPGEPFIKVWGSNNDNGWTASDMIIPSKDAALTADTYIDTPDVGTWKVFDVTNFVAAQAAGDNTATFVLEGPASGGGRNDVYFCSSAEAGFQPRLVITYAPPVVTDAKISINSGTGTGGAFKIGDTVTAIWNNTATGDNNSDISSVTVDFSQFGGGVVAATNSSGTWTASYTIAQGSIEGSNLNISVSATNSDGDFTTTTDTTNATVDNIAPAVVSVAVPAAGAYGTGQNLDFTVTFSQAVTVNLAGGTPRLALTLDIGGTVYAAYVSGSGTTALNFRYTVAADNNDDTGIALGTLSLNGGTIRDGGGNDADLTLNSVGSTANVFVDSIAPAAPSVPVLAPGSDTGYIRR